jgi:hypothetical protein
LLALICTEQQHLTEEQKASGTMRQGLLSQEIYTKNRVLGFFTQETFTKTPFSLEKLKYCWCCYEENGIGNNTDNSLILNSIYQPDA